MGELCILNWKNLIGNLAILLILLCFRGRMHFEKGPIASLANIEENEVPGLSETHR